MSNPLSNVCIMGTKYRLIKKIGKGSFGEVYLAIDKNGNEYACKTEDTSSKNRLKGEAHIYKRFEMRNLECVPKMYNFGESVGSGYNVLILQLLGKSVDTIFEERGGKLDIGTVMKLAITIISHLEKIHRAGIIHRDIKPNNFMFGINEHASDLYVMDFGLSKKWLIDGNHIEFKVGRSMIGTARYASMNIHHGTEPSRRDDMEAVGYMLVYLAKGSLPWQGLKKKTKDDPTDKIGDKKMMVDLKVLCAGLPDCFYDYINYTRNLQFTDKPDYEYLRELFITVAKSNNIALKYFWEDTGNRPMDNKNVNHKVSTPVTPNSISNEPAKTNRVAMSEKHNHNHPQRTTQSNNVIAKGTTKPNALNNISRCVAIRPNVPKNSVPNNTTSRGTTARNVKNNQNRRTHSHAHTHTHLHSHRHSNDYDSE